MSNLFGRDMANIEKIKADLLHFDHKNPRLVEFQITVKTKEKDIVNILWDEMAVNEIVMSILAHGFFENEAMYAVREQGKLIVVEGNRRLAAVKAILDPAIIENSGMNRYKAKITPDLCRQLESYLPVIILKDREEAWRYIGFKHVNGAAKWGSYAKAQYIASVHHDYGISLEDIAEQIGDTNKTVQKLFQGLMILQQADRETDFKIGDVYYKRLFFPHIYTALGYEGYQDFLGIKVGGDSAISVPHERLQELEDVMYWLYGSQSKDIKPVIESQNPDLKKLNHILQKRESVEALRSKNDLNIAFDLSQEGSDVLYSSLVEAKVALQKAMSKVSYYQGDLETLKQAGTVANTADSLYSNLENIKLELEGKTKKIRLSE